MLNEFHRKRSAELMEELRKQRRVTTAEALAQYEMLRRNSSKSTKQSQDESQAKGQRESDK